MKRANLMATLRKRGGVAILAWVCCAAAMASGQSLQVDPVDIQEIYRALQAPGATEQPKLYETDEGFIRFLGAPPGGKFAVRGTGAKAADPASKAASFIAEHAGAFGVDNAKVTFSTVKSQSRGGQSYVRLGQKYAGLPVFGAQAVVQLNGAGAVLNVMSDVLRDTRSLDSGAVKLAPTLTAAQALDKAKASVAADVDGVTVSGLSGAAPAELVILAPGVLGLQGVVQLAWHVQVKGGTASAPVAYAAFVNAQSGAVAVKYSLIEESKFRQIYDVDRNLLRQEGDPPVGNKDADNAYDYLGNTYDFYFNEHGRDAIDNLGSPMVATVGYPIFNAFWSSAEQEMVFGTGFITDDITAHELTHGVTEHESNLIYLGFSGAINESLSDIWGEYVDLTNGLGNDSDAVRWLMGEEAILGAIRSMKDPTIYGDPDRLGSVLLRDVDLWFIDNGGVHSNSGIGNKLCYLLTDGGTFNLQTIEGMGISKTADLFYETQFMMGMSADYYDLYAALEAAAITLGYSTTERCALAAAARAVEIMPPDRLTGVSDFQATTTVDGSGNPVVVLTWVDSLSLCGDLVTLLKSTDFFPVDETTQGVITVAKDTRDAVVDTSVVAGQDYYYTLVAPDPFGLLPSDKILLMAKVTAGEVRDPVWTQPFDTDTATQNATPFDLSHSQITFTPVGPPAAGAPIGYGGITEYEVTVKTGVQSLPVARNDASGNAFLIPLSYEGGVQVPFEVDPFWWIYYGYDYSVYASEAFLNFRFPFYDNVYSGFYVAANGYISFEPIAPFSNANAPTLAAHFSVPRIAFLYGVLGPDIAGEIWIRELPDRAVITFKEIPEDYVTFSPIGNTVQVEMFQNGKIRITYGTVSMTNAIVGLSPGGGVPIDPAEVFPNLGLVSLPVQSDLSASSTVATRLSLAPVAPQVGSAGDTISFMVDAVLPKGAETGDPSFSAEWNGPGAAPVADMGKSAKFFWPNAQAGVYAVRIKAMLAGEEAYEDVRLIVDTSSEGPSAINLALTSDIEIENGTLRQGHPLFASYDYTHPLEEQYPSLYGEGATQINWYRNGQIISGFTNRTTIEPSHLQAGDRWQFRVTPVTIYGETGTASVSNTVTILGGPEIISVTPSFGLVEGGDVVRIKGAGLNAPLSVKFGGVRAASFRVLGASEIEAVTPIHTAGTVSVEVTTALGSGSLAKGFTFLEDIGDILLGDVNVDGRVDALDVQLVVGAVLEVSSAKSAAVQPDVNDDGTVNSADVQFVINRALHR